MNGKCSHPARQQGTVLVTVLMMFAIAAFLAAEMAYRQKLDVRRTSAMLMTEQAREYLVGAEELAKLALKDDYKSDQRQQQFVDSLGEDWAQKRPPFPVDGGYIQGELIDAQSKFNLNDLVDMTSGTNTTDSAKLAKDQFIKLLNQLGVPKEGSAEAVYEKVVDWLDKGQDETGNDGREDSAYLRAKRPYRTGDRVFVDVSELRLIDEMDPETYAALEEHVVAIPPGTPKNLNTAEQELLLVMGLRQSADLLAAREMKPLVNDSDVDNYLPDDNTLKGILGTNTTFTKDKFKELVSRSSRYFELRAKAVIGGRTIYSRSLLYRSDSGAAGGKGGKLEVVYRAFVDPLQQPMTLPIKGQQTGGTLMNNNNSNRS